jgi:outer membrane protein TolC
MRPRAEEAAPRCSISPHKGGADYATGAHGHAGAETEILKREPDAADEINISPTYALRARRFKAAPPAVREPDPAGHAAVPQRPLPDEEVLWRQLSALNPQLATMRAMVDMAVAEVSVARTTGAPDFTAGLMADVKANPLMLRPNATMTLPIWRNKIKAVIASAEARRLAAEARLDAEQLAMAAEFAQTLFMVREADRMIAYIDTAALPNIERALASAEGAYQSGMGDFGTLATLNIMGLDMRLERAAAHREREAALADLSLLVATGVPADGLLLTSDK